MAKDKVSSASNFSSELDETSENILIAGELAVDLSTSRLPKELVSLIKESASVLALATSPLSSKARVLEDTIAEKLLIQSRENFEALKQHKDYGAVANSLQTLFDSKDFAMKVLTSNAVQDITKLIISGLMTGGMGVPITAAGIVAHVGMNTVSLNGIDVLVDEYTHLTDYKNCSNIKTNLLKIISREAVTTRENNITSLTDINNATTDTAKQIENILGIETSQNKKDPDQYEIKETTFGENVGKSIATQLAANFSFNLTMLTAQDVGMTITSITHAQVIFGLAHLVVKIASQASEGLSEEQQANYLKQEINNLRKETPAYNTHQEKYSTSSTIKKELGLSKTQEYIQVSRKYDLAQMALKEKANAITLEALYKNDEFKKLINIATNPNSDKKTATLAANRAKALFIIKQESVIEEIKKEKYYQANRTEEPKTKISWFKRFMGTFKKYFLRHYKLDEEKNYKTSTKKADDYLDKSSKTKELVEAIQSKQQSTFIKLAESGKQIKETEKYQEKAKEQIDRKIKSHSLIQRVGNVVMNPNETPVSLKIQDSKVISSSELNDIKKLLDKSANLNLNNSEKEEIIKSINNIISKNPKILNNKIQDLNGNEIHIFEYAISIKAPEKVFSALVENSDTTSIDKQEISKIIDIISQKKESNRRIFNKDAKMEDDNKKMNSLNNLLEKFKTEESKKYEEEKIDLVNGPISSKNEAKINELPISTKPAETPVAIPITEIKNNDLQFSFSNNQNNNIDLKAINSLIKEFDKDLIKTNNLKSKDIAIIINKKLGNDLNESQINELTDYIRKRKDILREIKKEAMLKSAKDNGSILLEFSVQNTSSNNKKNLHNNVHINNQGKSETSLSK